MIAPICPACDHIGHPTIVASSRFLPGPHKYRPADADGPLFATRKEAEEWVCATRCEHGDTTPTTAVPELRDIKAKADTTHGRLAPDETVDTTEPEEGESA